LGRSDYYSTRHALIGSLEKQMEITLDPGLLIFIGTKSMTKEELQKYVAGLYLVRRDRIRFTRKSLNQVPVSEHKIDASTTLLGAIKTIIIADAVMSLDNVIAIAGAAKDSIGLVIFGLLVSVPIIVWSSKLVMKLMDRFPIVIIIGAGLLGWIAGDMAITDAIINEWVNINAIFLHWLSPVCGVLVTVITGKWLAAKSLKKKTPMVDLIKDIEKP